MRYRWRPCNAPRARPGAASGTARSPYRRGDGAMPTPRLDFAAAVYGRRRAAKHAPHDAAAFLPWQCKLAQLLACFLLTACLPISSRAFAAAARSRRRRCPPHAAPRRLHHDEASAGHSGYAAVGFLAFSLWFSRRLSGLDDGDKRGWRGASYRWACHTAYFQPRRTTPLAYRGVRWLSLLRHIAAMTTLCFPAIYMAIFCRISRLQRRRLHKDILADARCRARHWRDKDDALSR